MASGLGLVGFSLNSAQAVYNSSSGVFAVRVNGGSLAIGAENTFQTALELTHDLTGQIGFSAAGRLFDGGYFRDIRDHQSVAGAVSLSGSEAGYLFEQSLADGSDFWIDFVGRSMVSIFSQIGFDKPHLLHFSPRLARLAILSLVAIFCTGLMAHFFKLGFNLWRNV